MRSCHGQAASGNASPEPAPIADAPLALAYDHQGGRRLYAVNQAARCKGLTPGMALADARAVCPDVQARAAEPARDAAALTMLAYWCQRYTPWSNVDGIDGLWLDISGCAHLFGGEQALCQDIRRRLQTQGFHARLGLADTPGAAWALSHTHHQAIAIAAPQHSAASLAPLPVAGLRLSDETLTLLRRFGLKTIGDLADLPRHALARRFSRRDLREAVLLRLDQALGLQPEPLEALREQPRYRCRLGFIEPIGNRDAIEQALRDLSARLSHMLCTDQKGARRLSLVGYRVEGDVTRIHIAMARASRSIPHIERLFLEKLELLDPGFGIETMMLEAHEVEELPGDQQDLADGARDEDMLGILTDRFLNRFGDQRVQCFASRASHRPERAQALASLKADDRFTPPRPALPPRPLSLFEPPEAVHAVSLGPTEPPLQVQWRRQLYRLVDCQGPERIAPEWWRDDDPAACRDYYRAMTENGHRLWLYREGLSRDNTSVRWYLQGLLP